MVEPSSGRLLKHCKKCQSVIPAGAIVCPVCQSGISDKPERSLVDVARFARDWIGFPAAVIAAITALFVPAKNNVLALLHWDRPQLSLDYLGVDGLNVGLDDTALAQQGNEVFISIPVVHYALTNSGPTAATVQPKMTCFAIEGSEPIAGNFYFIDTATTKRISDNFKLSAGESVFINLAMRDSGTVGQGYAPTKALNTCELSYVDKYGFQTLVIDLDDGRAGRADKKKSIDPIALGGRTDRRIGLRQQYCPDMAQGLELGGDPVDCLSDTQLFAIEPVYLWDNALQRVLRQTDEFRRMTAAERTPALILTSCDQNNCAPDEMLRALHKFTPKLTVWLCPAESPNHKSDERIVLTRDCTQHDFPAP